jgi:hypothetical protein
MGLLGIPQNGSMWRLGDGNNCTLDTRCARNSIPGCQYRYSFQAGRHTTLYNIHRRIVTLLMNIGVVGTTCLGRCKMAFDCSTRFGCERNTCV